MQARGLKMDLEEANVKLKKVTESERSMSASVASLRAELKNARAELAVVKEEGETAVAEKEAEIEVEMNHMRSEWEAAVSSDARLTESVTTLNEALHQVSRNLFAT